MTKAELRKKYAKLIGRPVRLGDEPDRIITDVLHEEPGGTVCVSTGELHAFSFDDIDGWKNEKHLADSLQALGDCNRKTRGRRKGNAKQNRT